MLLREWSHPQMQHAPCDHLMADLHHSCWGRPGGPDDRLCSATDAQDAPGVHPWCSTVLSLGAKWCIGRPHCPTGRRAVGPASSSFVACMREAELLEWEATELCAAAARKDAEAASKRLVVLNSFSVALSGTPTHQLRELIRVWKETWQVGPHLSVASGAASTSTMPACTVPVPSVVPAPIIATTAPNILGTVVSILDTRLGDSLGDLSDVNWAGIRETIAQSHITNSPAATSTIAALAAPMDVDDTV